MKKLYILITAVLFSTGQVNAKALVRVKAIGSSPRGQYVAFEEYGYKSERKQPFSKIRIMNVWKNKYMESPVHVVGTNEEQRLNQVRQKAKELASKNLKKFNISI